MKKYFFFFTFFISYFQSELKSQEYDKLYNILLNNSDRIVHSKLNSSNKNRELVILGDLPDNCISWQIYIGTGIDVEAVLRSQNEKEKNTNKVEKRK